MADQALLALGGGDMNGRQIASVSSPQLIDAMLSEARDVHDAARILGYDALLLAEARRVQPRIAQIANGITHDDVFVALQPLVILFGTPSYGDGEAGDALYRNWTVIYGRALSKLPREALEHAVSEWIERGTPNADGKFKGRPRFPFPEELITLAQPVHLRVATLAYRLKKAVDLADKVHGETHIAPDERERVKAMFADLRAQLGSKPNPLTDSTRLGRDQHRVADELRRAAG